jgi:hypothetical protein
VERRSPPGWAAGCGTTMATPGPRRRSARDWTPPRRWIGASWWTCCWPTRLDDAPPARVPAPLWSSFQEETRRFLRNVLLEEDHGVAQALTADFTFLDDRLATHYGLGTVPAGWSRISVDPALRGGLLGQGALLARAPSAPARGAYLLERIYGCQPLPLPSGLARHPPPAVTTASRAAVITAVGTDPACTVCHRVLDGPGLALQSYDELARLRTVDRDGRAIDASGWLALNEDPSPPVQVSGRQGLAEALAAWWVVDECFKLQLIRHAAARALIDRFDPAVGQCFGERWTSADGFHALVRALAEAMVVQWPRYDAGVPGGADAALDTAPDGTQ